MTITLRQTAGIADTSNNAAALSNIQMDNNFIDLLTRCKINGMTAKTPVAADEISLSDSAASWVQKKCTITALTTLLNGTTWSNATNSTNAAITAQTTGTFNLVMTSSNGGTNAGLSVSYAGAQAKLTYDAASYSLTALGNITAYSDERLKKLWKPLQTDFVTKLSKVRVGTFQLKKDKKGQRFVGVSAQSLQSLLPEAVMTDEDGMLSVAYGNAALAACVALAKEVVSLRARLDALEGK